MKTLNLFAAAFPLAFVLATPQLPFPTGTRAPCDRLGDVQCSPDGSHVQLCDGQEIRHDFHWKNIEDCGEPNGCHSRGPQNRAYCINKYPSESTHLGNVPTDVAVPVIETRGEVLTRDSIRCYETGARQCSPDKSTVQECTDMLFWKDVQDCFRPGCCHNNKMFPPRPACHCRGTLTTSVKGKATLTVAPRAEPLAPQREPNEDRSTVTRAESTPNDPKCINGKQACAANGQDLYTCVNGGWNLKQHCTVCKERNGLIACRNGHARADSSVSDTTPTRSICVDDQQKCGEDGKDMYICQNGDWKFHAQCDTCKENNEIFTCLSKISPSPSNVVTASVIWITLAATGSSTPFPEMLTPSPNAVCANGQSRCTSDYTSIEKCKNNAWKLDRKCSNNFGSHCVFYRNTAHCGYTNERPRTLDDCTNGQKQCSVDRQHIIVCEKGHWKDVQFCGPAGCDYKRPSYEPYCPYPPSRRAVLAWELV